MASALHVVFEPVALNPNSRQGLGYLLELRAGFDEEGVALVEVRDGRSQMLDLGLDLRCRDLERLDFTHALPGRLDLRFETRSFPLDRRLGRVHVIPNLAPLLEAG